MPKFTITAAFYDSWSDAHQVIDAPDLEAACAEAIRRIDDGEVTTTVRTFDPTETFVAAAAAGAWDSGWNGDCLLIPARFTEKYVDPNRQRSTDDLAIPTAAELRKSRMSDAAEDMFAALSAFLEIGYDDGDRAAFEERQETARVAIAKAKGEDHEAA